MTGLTPSQFDHELKKLAALLKSRKPSPETRRLIKLQAIIAQNAIDTDLKFAECNPETRIAKIMLQRADIRQFELDKILDR